MSDSTGPATSAGAGGSPGSNADDTAATSAGDVTSTAETATSATSGGGGAEPDASVASSGTGGQTEQDPTGLEPPSSTCTKGSYDVSTRTGGLESMGSRFADVDGDTLVDLVFTNQLDETATVFWGDGTNEFGKESTTFNIGRTQSFIDFGDLDGDGLKDAVSSNQDHNMVRIARQTAPRVFAAASSQSQSGFPQGVVLFDANRDGRLDLLVQAGGCQKLRLGTGSGNFNVGACVQGIPGDVRVRAADFDADGWDDLVWPASPTTLALGVVAANGTIASVTSIPVAGYTKLGPHDVVDLDHDGRVDIVMTAQVAAERRTVVLYNVGPLVLEPCEFGLAPAEAYAFGDLDGDAKPEMSWSTTCGYCTSTYHLGRAK